MCGFLGQYSPHQTPKSAFLANLILAQHRGPDQTSYWADELVQLGFNRLAVVDLSEAGHQPMLSRQGNWVVVFNGEIYNHLSIRNKISGYTFKGHSDTETIVAGLELWGFEQTIAQLIGMFAIAAYHKPTHKLYIARDSVGIKPFFYSTNPTNFWFASQFSQIIVGLGKANVSLQPEGIRDYLQFGYMQAPNTIYREIKQLEPGQMAEVSAEGIKLKTFAAWPVQPQTTHYNDQQSEALTHFNQLFAQVCHDQLQADVPVATFLSSGIDSTLVNAYSKAYKSDLTAYTIGVAGASDERPVASKYADILGVKHQQKEFTTQELLASLNDHFQKLGEPFADFSSLPTYLICKKARESSTVMLSGDGGDELFWGYHRFYKSTANFDFFKESLLKRKIKKKLRVFPKPASGAIYEFDSADEMVENDHSHISQYLFGELMPGIGKSKETEVLYRFNDDGKVKFRNWLRYNEFYAHMQRVLIKVDRMSMAHSLEVRVPFLDQRVVDFAWNLNSDFGLDQSVPQKTFLKKALAQFIPAEKMNTQKMGFYIPIGNWLKGSLREEAQDLLLNQPILGEEYINRKAWNKYVTNFYQTKGSSNEWGIWIMYCWQKWGQELHEL